MKLDESREKKTRKVRMIIIERKKKGGLRIRRRKEKEEIPINEKGNCRA